MLLTFILTFVVRPVKSAGILPKDLFKQVMGYSRVQKLHSLSRLNHEWNQDCEEETSRRRAAERLKRAELVDELEGFRTKTLYRFDSALISQMNASDEIEHYLNGFDLRMYDWMMAIHFKVDGAVQQQIEEFATKLAEHRATYPRPPPHRRRQQEEMPKFDAFIKMRDNIMEILQNRMLKDHVMFDYLYDRKALSLERSAMMHMMLIMETIGIEIGYPGVQEMQKDLKSFVGSSQDFEKRVQELLVRTVDITKWEYIFPYGSRKSLMGVLSLESCIGRKAADDVVENVRAFIPDTVEGVLQLLGIPDCIEILKTERCEFRDLPILEPEDLTGERGIGLTAEQTRRIVMYFRPTHPAYAPVGELSSDGSEPSNIVVDDEALGRNEDCQEGIKRAELVNELEGFERHIISKMDTREEIEHYLNGFDLRMYEWMMALHIEARFDRASGAVRQQIEEFARKLAQHQATYPRPLPHRRGQQEEMPKFDAFIRMRDNNMEILRNRMKKDDRIMFPWNLSSGPLSLEHSAMIQMMLIMETIGIAIGYPGVQEMHKDYKSFGLSQDFEEQVQELLVGTVDITKWEYIFLDGTKKSLIEVLSLESCIGVTETQLIVQNIKKFVDVWRMPQQKPRTLWSRLVSSCPNPWCLCGGQAYRRLRAH